MKKILILGGADIQVTAIKRARELGLYVITCDYLPDNPGHKYSDEYHNVSTTDKEKVLELSQQLNIDGILPYASDPAAQTAAYVAEKMGLVSNPFDAVEVLTSKDLFRKKIREIGLNTPEAGSFSDYSSAYEWAMSMNRDLIIKPVDSSGSKGVFFIQKGCEDFSGQFADSIGFSRSKKVILEEFIRKKGHQVGGDGFLVNGELVFRCFGDIHFSKSNPLLPCSVSVPSLHDKAILDQVHEKIQKILTALKMQNGGLNFDVIIDERDEIYIVEIGPRNGGNMIPELTKYCTGVDMITASILQSVNLQFDIPRLGMEKEFFSHYVIHSLESGTLMDVELTDELKKHLLFYKLNHEIGDSVGLFRNSSNRMGVMLLQYPDKETMIDIIYNMNKYLKLKVD